MECVSKERVLESLKRFTGRSDVKLLDGIEVRRASESVEGLTSIVLRVKAPYSFEGVERKLWKTFIVKVLPTNDFQKDVVERCRLFVKETTFFNYIVPFLVTVSEGKVSVPLPECYYAACDGGGDAVYLEDLSEMGYKITDVSAFKIGLDYEHCTLVMRTLGKFHAQTYAAEQSLVPTRSWVQEFPMFSRDFLFYHQEVGGTESPLRPLVKSCVETFVKMSRLLDGTPKELEANGSLRNALENNWSNLCRLVRPNPQGFNVLSHGDCWINNMLFRYDGDVPVDLKLIDMQIVRFCHPAVDIFYFMYLCTRRDFREKNLDGLVDEYHSSFVQVLKVLGVDDPPISLDKLKQDLAEYRAFGIAINCSFTPTMFLGEDFLPSNSGELSVDQLNELYNNGNSTLLLRKFCGDPSFKSQMESLIIEFIDWAFP